MVETLEGHSTLLNKKLHRIYLMAGRRDWQFATGLWPSTLVNMPSCYCENCHSFPVKTYSRSFDNHQTTGILQPYATSPVPFYFTTTSYFYNYCATGAIPGRYRKHSTKYTRNTELKISNHYTSQHINRKLGMQNFLTVKRWKKVFQWLSNFKMRKEKWLK